MISRRLHVLALLLVLASGSIYGHHSLSEYDASRRVTLNAVVREFHFVNPHPYLLVDGLSTGPGASRVEAASRIWRLELDNRFELIDIGMTAKSFARGDELLVSGPPGRDDQAILYVRELYRAEDGFRYEQVGNTPQIIRAPLPGRRR